MFRPFLLWVNDIANRLVAKSGVKPVDRAAVGGRDAETIRHLVEYSTQVGALNPVLQHQISDVIAMEELTVEAITTPNAEPVSVGPDAVVADVRAAALASGHLRILQRDGDGRLPLVVHVRDTLEAHDEQRADDFARPSFRVDASTKVYELLRMMRDQHVQLALVVQGEQLLGIVTLTDVIRRLLPSTDAAAQTG